jgi:cell division protein FtsW
MSAGNRGRSRSAPPLEYSLLLTATLCLLALGAVMVFSASSAKSLLAEGGGDGFYYLKRTVVFAGIGLVVLRFASIRGVQVARLLTPALLALSIFLLLAVLLPGVGSTVNGAQRWLGAGLFQFQPSELAKFAIVLYGAHLLAARPKRVRSLQGLLPYLLVVGLAALLIARQPDLGSATVLCFAVCCVLFAAGVSPRALAPVGAVIAIGGLAIVAMNPYQQERLTGFLNPGADSTGAGFQGTQATIAVGSGSILGVGLGESVQKASYLPEAHTDMIAAVLGEETGLAGMIVLIGLFGMFGYAGFRAAHRARDRFSKLLAAGLTSLIMAQVAVNLFAVLGLAPLTGVPLPFVSYGGTSLVITLTAAGLILNVARRPAAAGTRRRPAATSTRSKRATSGGAAGAAAKLRLVEGKTRNARVLRAKRGATRTTRKRATSGTSRDSGRRHGGARRAGARRRRRAAR